MMHKYIILSIITSIISTYGMQAYIAQSSGAIWGILFVMTAILFSCIFRMKIQRRTIAAALLLGSIYALMALGDYELNVNGGVDLYFRAILIFIGNIVFFTITLSGVFTYLLSRQDTASNTGLGRRSTFRFIAKSLGLLMCWLPYYLACFPGNMTSDTIGEIRQQLGESPLSNHHPVIHQLMIRIGLIIGRIAKSYRTGIGILTLLQMAALSLTFAGCLEYLRRRGIKKRITTILFLFYALCTVNGFYSVTLYKDVPFAIASLLLVILLTKELRGEYITRKARILSVIAISVTGFFFCTIRNNGYYAFLLGYLLIFLINMKKDWKRLLLIGISTLILVSGYKIVLFDIMGISGSASGEMLGIPLQMIARVVKYDEPAFDEENFITLGEVFPDYNALAENYCQDNSDPIKKLPVFDAECFDKEPLKYAKSWMKVGLNHPKTYIEAFLIHTHGFWSFDKSASITASIYPNEYGLTQTAKFEQLKYDLIKLHDFTSSLPLVSSIQSYGIVIVLLLFSIASFIVNGTIKEFSPILIIAFLWLTAIAAPACLYQYVYGITVTLPFFLAFAVNGSLTDT